jgi:hypothetical protein
LSEQCKTCLHSRGKLIFLHEKQVIAKPIERKTMMSIQSLELHASITPSISDKLDLTQISNVCAILRLVDILKLDNSGK